MNQACFGFFEPVRFSTDIDDLFDPYVSSAQQSDSLLAAGLSLGIPARTLHHNFSSASALPQLFCVKTCPILKCLQTAKEKPARGRVGLNRILSSLLDRNFVALAHRLYRDLSERVVHLLTHALLLSANGL